MVARWLMHWIEIQEAAGLNPTLGRLCQEGQPGQKHIKYGICSPVVTPKNRDQPKVLFLFQCEP